MTCAYLEGAIMTDTFMQDAVRNPTPTHFIVTEDMLRNCESGE